MYGCQLQQFPDHLGMFRRGRDWWALNPKMSRPSGLRRLTLTFIEITI
jgi:hypothetical protein